MKKKSTTGGTFLLKHNTLVILSTGLVAGILPPQILLADDLTIDETLDSQVRTSEASGGTAGDITIESGGISVDDGTALVVDSSNSLENEGTLDTDGWEDATGLHIDTSGGDIAGTIANNGAITSSYRTDEDEDDVYEYGENNFGLLLEGTGTFTGDITHDNTAAITVYGKNSAGISLRADMVGDLTVNSATVYGENSNAVELLSDLDGNISITGSLTAQQAGSHGYYQEGNVTGGLYNLGTLTTGTGITSVYDDDAEEYVAVPAVAGIASLRISGNLGAGLVNDRLFYNDEGTQVTLEDDDDPDDYSTDNSYLTAYGGGYALLISPEKLYSGSWTDITVGGATAYDRTYSVMNYGQITASGLNAEQETVAIRIAGAEQDGTLYRATLTDGFYNGAWGEITSTAVDATSTAMSIGEGASLSTITNDGLIEVYTERSEDDDDEPVGDGGNAYGIVIDEGATVTDITNSGTLYVEADGLDTNAYGIVDYSGSVSTFTNSGLVYPVLGEDNAGEILALDFSANTTGIDFANSGYIHGDVLLGSGTNNINLTGGSIYGTLYLYGGTSILNMSGGATLTRGIYSANGQLDISITDNAALTVPSSTTLDANDITVSNSGELRIAIDGISGKTGMVNAAGTVTFESGSTLTTELESLVATEESFTVLSAGSLDIADDDILSLVGIQPFIYDVTTSVTDTDLSLTLRRKSATELGLDNNTGALYEGSVAALLDDDELANALGNLTTEEEFVNAYRQLMPNSLSLATRQAAIMSGSLVQGAISGHLNNLRDLQSKPTNLKSPKGVWLQESGTIYDQKSAPAYKGFDGYSFGIAAGFDMAATEKGVIGIGLSRHWSEFDIVEGGSEPLISRTSLGTLYTSWLFDDFYLQGNISGGYVTFDSERTVEIDDVERSAVAEWDGYQLGANLGAGYLLTLGDFSLRPEASLNYLTLHENGYTETEGGNAVNLTVSEHDSSSLTGALKGSLLWTKEFSYLDEVYGKLVIDLHGAWQHEFKTDPLSFEASFTDYGDSFTLTGDRLAADSYLAGAGFSYTTSFTTLSLQYDLEKKEGYTGHSASLTYRFRF